MFSVDDGGGANDGGSLDGGSASCPTTPPTDNSACTIETLQCEYGSAPQPMCNTSGDVHEQSVARDRSVQRRRVPVHGQMSAELQRRSARSSLRRRLSFGVCVFRGRVWMRAAARRADSAGRGRSRALVVRRTEVWLSDAATSLGLELSTRRSAMQLLRVCAAHGHFSDV